MAFLRMQTPMGPDAAGALLEKAHTDRQMCTVYRKEWRGLQFQSNSAVNY